MERIVSSLSALLNKYKPTFEEFTQDVLTMHASKQLWSEGKAPIHTEVLTPSRFAIESITNHPYYRENVQYMTELAFKKDLNVNEVIRYEIWIAPTVFDSLVNVATHKLLGIIGTSVISTPNNLLSRFEIDDLKRLTSLVSLVFNRPITKNLCLFDKQTALMLFRYLARTTPLELNEEALSVDGSPAKVDSDAITFLMEDYTKLLLESLSDKSRYSLPGIATELCHRSGTLFNEIYRNMLRVNTKQGYYPEVGILNKNSSGLRCAMMRVHFAMNLPIARDCFISDPVVFKHLLARKVDQS